MFIYSFINSPNIFLTQFLLHKCTKIEYFNQKVFKGQKSKHQANSTKASEKDKLLKKLMKKAETCFEEGKKRKVRA